MLQFLFGHTNTRSQHKKEAFTTQFEMLEKYGQLTHDDGETIGICRPMTQAYLLLLLRGKNPSHYLQDGKRFLAEAIEEENREIDALKKNPDTDVDHYAFVQKEVPHSHKSIKTSDFTPEFLQKQLEEHPHMVVQFPTKSEADAKKPSGIMHQVYIGKSDSSSCRFFDANFPGGETVAPCPDVIRSFYARIKKQWPEDDNTYVSLGIS